MRRSRIVLTSLAIATIIITQAYPQPPGGRGRRFGRGHDERHDEDHQVFRFLLANHKKITREVKELPNGVETLTESDDPAVAAKLKEHVRWMEYRITEAKPIRMRDPLFRELFRHTHKIKMERTETEKGVRVLETSDDSHVVGLIKSHAKVVSGFVARGFGEAMKNHPVPNSIETKEAESANPAIKKYGAVVQLPDAAQQPREGSRIVVDVTKGGEATKLNPAIEKLSRYVNIYAGAGKVSTTATIAVVIHGDATLSVLNADAYTQRFNVQDNPNLECLRELHEAGVQIFVCGQSLIAKGATPEEVLVFTDVAVSALTSLVNLQDDGHAYIALR